MPLKELKTLIRTLRAQGVVSYEHNGLKLLLDPNHQPAKRTVANKRQTSTKRNDSKGLQEEIDGILPSLSDEQWLLSTNNIDSEVLGEQH